MAKIPFNVDAYTARLIGRENVSKLNGAILELVKNTYDADANICILYYEESSEALYLIDNGNGMTEETIKNHWMTIGRSSKKNSFISDKGRVQTGAKGIGRFALDRIADECSMLTISSESKLLWEVNWASFENNNNITDVTAELNNVELSVEEFLKNITNNEVKELVNKEFKKAGTIFRLTKLRDIWNKKTIGSIKENLSTLIPYELKTTFNIYFFDEYSSKEDAAVLHDSDAFSYDYKINFEVKEDERVFVKIFRNEFDFKDDLDKVLEDAEFEQADKKYFSGKPVCYKMDFKDIFPKKDGIIENTIGAFNGVFYFAKKSESKEDKNKYYYKDSDPRRNYMENFGGIKIYRDGFRVRPYGEPKTSTYDWLLLSGRKNRSPAAISHHAGSWRVNADQILGSIFISRLNVTLPDQSNREGIVETKEFGIFKQFILYVIQLFERDRQYVFRKLNLYYEKKNKVPTIIKEVEEKVKKGKSNAKSKDSLIEVSKVQLIIDQHKHLVSNLEEEIKLLRALATTGIVTNSYIHEVKGQTHKLSLKIVNAKECLEEDKDMDKALEYILQANSIRESFTSWFKVTIESVKRDKRTMKELEICSFISSIVMAWSDTLKSKNINIIFTKNDKDIRFKCFPYEIDVIFSNLITNSVSSFDSSSADACPTKEILIQIEEDHDYIIIDYRDTGIGLLGEYKNDPQKILEPFETDKRNEFGESTGTGMGMWIIKSIISEYNGNIDLSKNKSGESGFYVKLFLKKK